MLYFDLLEQAQTPYMKGDTYKDDIFINKEHLPITITRSLAVLMDASRCHGQDEQFCEGFEVGEHIMDINVVDGELMGKPDSWFVEAIECHDDANGYHTRGYKWQFLYQIEKTTAALFTKTYERVEKVVNHG